MRRPIPVSLGTATIGTIRRKMTNTKKVTGIMRLNWKKRKKEKYLSLLVRCHAVSYLASFFSFFFISNRLHTNMWYFSPKLSALSPVFIFFWSHVTHQSKAARVIRWSPCSYQSQSADPLSWSCSKSRKVALLVRKSFLWYSRASFMLVILILEFILDNLFNITYSVSAFCAISQLWFIVSFKAE